MNDEKGLPDRLRNGKRRAYRGILACLSLSYSGKAGDCFRFPPTTTPSFLNYIFSFFLDFFFVGGGWGLTYTHAGFGCSFLVFRVRVTGGLWGWGGLVLYA